MTAIFLVILAMSDPEVLLRQHKYSELALELQAAAHRFNDPIAIRNYATLITEYYSAEIAFRTFFIKDLRQGESVSGLRHSTETLSIDSHGPIIEQNLEAFLLEALKKFPDNQDIQFACANYVFRGRCCQTLPKLKQEPEQTLAIFKAADSRGLFTATSLWALALDALNHEQLDRAYDLIGRGLALRPDDADLTQAYMNELLRRKDYDKGIEQARKLFEITFNPEARADALLGAARGLFAQRHYKEAADTAWSAQKIVPLHPLALFIALDSLRAAGGGSPYQDAMLAYLASYPTNPLTFEAYVNYLKTRGIKEEDRQLMSRYAEKESASELEEITSLINQGHFGHLDHQPKICLNYYQMARKKAEKLKEPPPDLIGIIDKLIASAQAQN